MSPPIPARMACRPVHHGLAVPYITATDADGAPLFRVNDERRRQEVLAKRWCGMCGTPFEYWMVFIVADGAARALVLEPPQHEECARYVLASCPYFASERYQVKDRPVTNLAPAVRVVDTLKEPAGPMVHDRIGLYFTRDYKTVLSGGEVMARPAPAKCIEWVRVNPLLAPTL